MNQSEVDALTLEEQLALLGSLNVQNAIDVVRRTRYEQVQLASLHNYRGIVSTNPHLHLTVVKRLRCYESELWRWTEKDLLTWLLVGNTPT